VAAIGIRVGLWVDPSGDHAGRGERLNNLCYGNDDKNDVAEEEDMISGVWNLPPPCKGSVAARGVAEMDTAAMGGVGLAI
jgi:hypothetical protein